MSDGKKATIIGAATNIIRDTPVCSAQAGFFLHRTGAMPFQTGTGSCENGSNLLSERDRVCSERGHFFQNGTDSCRTGSNRSEQDRFFQNGGHVSQNGTILFRMGAMSFRTGPVISEREPFLAEGGHDV